MTLAFFFCLSYLTFQIRCYLYVVFDGKAMWNLFAFVWACKVKPSSLQGNKRLSDHLTRETASRNGKMMAGINWHSITDVSLVSEIHALCPGLGTLGVQGTSLLVVPVNQS